MLSSFRAKRTILYFFLIQPPHFIKNFSAYDWFMGIFTNNPLIFICEMTFLIVT